MKQIRNMLLNPIIHILGSIFPAERESVETEQKYCSHCRCITKWQSWIVPDYHDISIQITPFYIEPLTWFKYESFCMRCGKYTQF